MLESVSVRLDIRPAMCRTIFCRGDYVSDLSVETLAADSEKTAFAVLIPPRRAVENRQASGWIEPCGSRRNHI
ncbi:hypothetical protein TNCV_406581 [Trichonephila clavipes]|nr:hypothetical protein TNCV_406581 [Trichonephila clavipes]